jgi:O-antigen ligase
VPAPDGRPGYFGYLGLIGFTLLIITYYLPGAIVAAALASSAVVIAILAGRLKLALRPEGTLLLLFLGLATVSVPSSVDGFMASIRIEELAKLVLIYMVCIHVLNSMSRIWTFAALWTCAFVLFPIRGTFVNYLGGYRIEGRAIWNYVFENPNDLAALTLITAFVAGALLVVARHRLIRIGLIAAISAASVVILLSGSRGVFLGSAVAVLTLTWYRRQRARTLAGLALLCMLWVAFAPDAIRERMATLRHLQDAEAARQYDAGSMQERLYIWNTAFEIIGDHPLFGVGIGSFSTVNAAYRRDDSLAGESFGGAAAEGQDAHSTYISVWVELGSIGLALYVALFAMTWWRVSSVRRRSARSFPELASPLQVLDAGLLGYFVSCLWATYTVLTLPYIFLGLCLSWAVQVQRSSRQPGRSQGEHQTPGTPHRGPSMGSVRAMRPR